MKDQIAIVAKILSDRKPQILIFIGCIVYTMFRYSSFKEICFGTKINFSNKHIPMYENLVLPKNNYHHKLSYKEGLTN